MQASQPNLTGTQKRNILFAMCLALVAVVASVSGLNVAQQEIAASLNASASDVLWIINSYTVALAALLMPVGAIGDRFGRKPVLLTGLVVFAVASLGASLATSVSFMIISRVLTGIGAAMVMPVTLSVITSSFPEDERPRAIGIWAGFAGAGGIIGLWMSSIMVDFFDWRFLFALPIALMVISAVVSFFAVPNSREVTGSFDVAGSILSAIAIGGIVFGIHEGPERGWSDSLAFVPISVGLIALVSFIYWEAKTEHPLLDVSVFKDRNLASGTLTITFLFAVMFGVFLVLFPFLKTVFGWSSVRSAFAMLPMAFMMMPMSTVAPLVAQRVGRRTTILVGLGFAISGLAALAIMVSPEAGYLGVLPGLMILGLGMGLTMTPSTESITATLPTSKQGVASALNDTSREVGGAVGVALLGSILTSSYSDNMASFASKVTGLPVGKDYFIDLKIASELTDQPSLALEIVSNAQHAYTNAWSNSMWVGVAILVLAFIYIVFRGPANFSSSE